MSRIRVLIAEDHQTVRDGLRLLVGTEPDMEVVGLASDGREAVRLTRELQPDVAVMDVSMPGMDGLQATAKITESCPRVRVLALTRHDDTGFLRQLLGAGAKGYVLKQSASAELIRAVRAVAAGGSYLDPAVAGKVVEKFAGRDPEGSPRGGAEGAVSEREEEVLRLIAQGHANKEVAARLSISVRTVEVHKANAMRKLGMTSRIDIVRYALLRGWL